MDGQGNTKYYIREIAFGYDDEYNFPMNNYSKVNLNQKAFNSIEEARSMLKYWNHEHTRGMMVSNYRELTPYVNDEVNRLEMLIEYLKENVEGPPLTTDERGKIWIDRNYFIPRTITSDQAWKIREITGIHFHDIVAVENGKLTYWGMRYGKWANEPGAWVEGNAAIMGENYSVTHKKIPVYFASKEIAEIEINRRLFTFFYSLNIKGIHGTYEELSDTPLILKSFIENSKDFNYNEKSQKIELPRHHSPHSQHIVFNGLLKDKLATVALFSDEEINKIGTDWGDGSFM